MFDESVANLRNMYQTILMDTDIHKHAEVNDIADSAFQDHAFFQILHGQYVTAKDRGRGFITRVTTGFFQFLDDILQSRQTNAQFFRCFFCHADFVCQTFHLTRRHIIQRITAEFQQCFRRLIAFGMNASFIQRHIAFGNAQEAGALFKGFGTQFGHFFQFFPVMEQTVFFTICENIFRNGVVDACYIRKQSRACGVQVNANTVYAVFHHAA